MKGDGNIKNVILRFIGVGINDTYQAYVIIHDKDNKMVYSGYTYNSEIELLVNENNIYKVEAFFCGEIIKTSFYINNSNIYVFKFKHAIYKRNNTVTFLLTDFYYKNLKIKKGEILLWQT